MPARQKVANISLGSKVLASSARVDGEYLVVDLSQVVELEAGQKLRIVVS